MVKREHIPAKLRHEVFKRDKYRCRECGATNKETTLKIDHIVPVSKGGTNNINNLQTLCKECNRAKNNRTWVVGEQSQKIIFTHAQLWTYRDSIYLMNALSVKVFFILNINFTQYNCERYAQKPI